MEFLVISLVSLAVSALTLFSGFGLGTLLMPAFAIFFPVNIAIAATAVVHLANNIFKLFLVGRYADIKTAIRFTIPAVVFSVFGAYLLVHLQDSAPLIRYEIGGRVCEITVIKLVIAALIAFFSYWDLSPETDKIEFSPKYVPVGGALSGFFGGLSGLQGALRSAFLIKCGLTKEEFIGTGVLSAVAVDVSRLIVYGATFVTKDFSSLPDHGMVPVIMVGILAAFMGSFIGNRLMKKVALRTVQFIVGGLLFIFALALGSGLI